MVVRGPEAAVDDAFTCCDDAFTSCDDVRIELSAGTVGDHLECGIDTDPRPVWTVVSDHLGRSS